jgi:hypothetical protein
VRSATIARTIVVSMPATTGPISAVDMEFPTGDGKKSYRDGLGSNVNIAPRQSNGGSNPMAAVSLLIFDSNCRQKDPIGVK